LVRGGRGVVDTREGRIALKGAERDGYNVTTFSD
jgi:hypothetical protein